MKSPKTKFLLALCASAMVLGLLKADEAKNIENKIEVASNKLVKDAEMADLKVTEDFDAAFKKAKENGKKVLLAFTGSEWCPPCKMLDALVLKTKKFANYADKELEVVLADFNYRDGPKSKKFGKQHAILSREFQVTGFPTLILIDPKTGMTARFEGLMFSSPDEIIEAFNEVDELNAKASETSEKTNNNKAVKSTKSDSKKK